MTLDEYIKYCFIPNLNALRRIEKENKNKFSEYVKICVRNACYGFEGCGNRYASKKAQERFQKTYPDKIIHKYSRNEQKKFDTKARQPGGRPNGEYFFEHVLPNNMLIKLILSEIQGNESLNVKNVRKLIETNYCTAWILKEENDLLTKKGLKSERGESLETALKAYYDNDIILIDTDGKEINNYTATAEIKHYSN